MTDPVPFLRTPCPACCRTAHAVVNSKVRGFVRVRIHECECGNDFVSHEHLTRREVAALRRPERRKAKVPRQ